jgi:WD40 repeat protein
MKPFIGCAAPLIFIALCLGQTSTPPGMLRNGTGAVVFLRFSPDGRHLARICQFGPVAIFDTASYRTIRSFDIEMRMVAWNKAGTLLATAEGTDGARVWGATDEGRARPGASFRDVDAVRVLDHPVHVLSPPGQGAARRIFWAEFSPDGSRLITTGASGNLDIWNTDSWASGGTIQATGEIRSVAFDPTGKTVYFGDANGVIHHIDLATKKEMDTLQSPLCCGCAHDGAGREDFCHPASGGSNGLDGWPHDGNSERRCVRRRLFRRQHDARTGWNTG